MEEVHEVLGRDVPGGAGREGASPEPADRGVEDGRPGLERRERVRVARAAGVVEVAADRDSELRGLRDERPHLSRDRHSDRVGEEDRVRGALGDALGEAKHPSLVDPPLERAPERDADDHGGADPVRPRPRDDPVGRCDRLVDRRVLVSPVERLGRAEGEPDLVQPAGGQALVSALVQREPCRDDPVPAFDRRDDVLRARHLRHAAWVDEARDLDGRETRGHESVDEVGPHIGGEHVRLVLEAVPRPDVDDGHARGRTPRAHLSAIVVG